MACVTGSKIASGNLVMNFDAANIKSFGPLTVDALVVAGGGGGGTNMGGGGGGGGVLYSTGISVTSAMSVTVGGGGAGAPAGTTGGHPTVPGSNGGNSIFGSLTAIGGGYGGVSYNNMGAGIQMGAAGGSGGGSTGYNNDNVAPGYYGSGAGTAGQGYRGGLQGNMYFSGGGGGAAGPGADGNNIAHGGPGVCYPAMSPHFFGGGGGGAAYSNPFGGNGGIGGGGGAAVGATFGGIGYNNGSVGGGGSPNSQTNTPGGNAGANTGGGGGGGSHYNWTNKGGDGGSGIVIIKYAGRQKATGGIVVTMDGFTTHTFTSSGTFTPGVYLADSSSSGLIGTLTNGPTYSSSNNGVIVFDGSNDSISTPAAYFALSGGGTMEMWVKLSAININQGFFSIQSGGSYIDFYMPSYNLMRWEVIGSTGSAYTTINSTTTFSAGVWYHVVGVFDGSNTRIHVNGVQETSQAMANQPTSITAPVIIGTYAAYSPCSIANARFYTRALSAVEVRQNFQALRGRFGI